MSMRKIGFLSLARWTVGLYFSVGLLFSDSTQALELEGFLTSKCEKKVGIIVNVNETGVEYIDLDGRFQSIQPEEIETLYIFNVIENPFEVFHIDKAAQARLKAIYLEDSSEPRTLAFPVRYIEDLLIFFSLEGKSHVHTFADIYKLRPASDSVIGDHRPKAFKKMDFSFTDQSTKCADLSNAKSTEKLPEVKPTRVLADKISVSEFLNSFKQGSDALDSFQERTYLYSRPFLFEKKTRLGLVFQGARSEPGLTLPMYFQWASGDPYRFQSFTAIGSKNQEWTPNTEPVFAVRSDVKSHAFHATFVGNIYGMPAGNKIFLNDSDIYRPKGDLTVQPSFNYLALMGADYGPYTLSLGFFYPTYGIKVGKEYREVRGTSASYAIRGMYTKRHFRLRAIGSLTQYSSDNPSTDDVVVMREDSTSVTAFPNSYSFKARFLRGGVDYELSERLKVGLDGILVNGNYKETIDGGANDIKFNKMTIQPYVTQSFGNYVSLTGYANFNQNDYKSNFLSVGDTQEKRETVFFGTFEFIF